MSLYNKKEKELEVARFFIDRHNIRFGTDYIVNLDEKDHEIDCVASSTSKALDDMNIQVTTTDTNLIENALETIKKPRTVIPMYNKWEDDIVDSITKKSDKYPDELKESVVLLVRSDWAISFNHDYLIGKTKKVSRDSKFKSIYYIKLPDSELKETFPTNKWQIIPLI